MNKYPCQNCGKINEAVNYCDWNWNIEAAKKDGGAEVLPNGFPIKCILADGTMLECEHGDHPTYKYPVTVEYRGEIPEDLEKWDTSYCSETHALIYEDGYIALTLSECTYYMWRLLDGQWMSGSSWYNKSWYLTKESLEKINENHNS
jgi:hypothetical protein